MIQVRQRGNAIVLTLGERRGLMFYVSATHDVHDKASTAEIDVFCRPVDEFAARYTEAPSLPVRDLLVRYRCAGIPVQSAAAVQLAYLDGIAKKRGANWLGDALGNNERRNQPRLVRGRKPKKTSKNCALLARQDVDYEFSQAADRTTAAQRKIQEPSMTAKKITVKSTDAKTSKTADKAPVAKPSKIGGKPATKAEKPAPKAEKPATKAEKPAPKAEKPAESTESTEGATRGRKRDGELYDAKVQATEKAAKEGSFYADVQAAAKKPVKLSTLISKMEELHPTQPEMKHHQRAAAMTVDSLKRMCYIALVEA